MWNQSSVLRLKSLAAKIVTFSALISPETLILPSWLSMSKLPSSLITSPMIYISWSIDGRTKPPVSYSLLAKAF